MALTACVPAASEPSPSTPGTTVSADVRIVNAPGQTFSLDDVIVPGKVTVVDFYADWCAPCRDIDHRLRTFAAQEPRVAIRKINVVHMESPVAVQYRLDTLPFVLVIDQQGTIRHRLAGPQARRAAAYAARLISSPVAEENLSTLAER